MYTYCITKKVFEIQVYKNILNYELRQLTNLVKMIIGRNMQKLSI